MYVFMLCCIHMFLLFYDCINGKCIKVFVACDYIILGITYIYIYAVTL